MAGGIGPAGRLGSRAVGSRERSRGRTGASHSPEHTLVAWLRPRESLIVLANGEHLIDGCALCLPPAGCQCRYARRDAAIRLLGASVRTTSRESLRVTGESVWPVPPLAVPRLPPTSAA